MTSFTRYPALVSDNDNALASLPGPTIAICGFAGIAAAYQAVSPETKIRFSEQLRNRYPSNILSKCQRHPEFQRRLVCSPLVSFTAVQFFGSPPTTCANQEVFVPAVMWCVIPALS